MVQEYNQCVCNNTQLPHINADNNVHSTLYFLTRLTIEHLQ
uniref:Uncharacterized protein n=1 Tax=Anguilla anguilla TaxID=7936 RepID=A0A0E9Q6Q0_ANGAN